MDASQANQIDQFHFKGHGQLAFALADRQYSTTTGVIAVTHGDSVSELTYTYIQARPTAGSFLY